MNKSPIDQSPVCEYVRPPDWSPLGPDFGTSSRVAAVCDLWFDCLGPLAQQIAEPTPRAYRVVTRNLLTSTHQNLSLSRLQTKLKLRSLFEPPDVGITYLDLRPTRVRTGRREESWQAHPSHAQSTFGSKPFKKSFNQDSSGTRQWRRARIGRFGCGCCSAPANKLGQGRCCGSRLAHAQGRLPVPGLPVTRARSAGWADCRGGGGWRGGRAPTPGGRCRGEVRAGGLRRALRSVSREQAGSGVAQGGPGSGAPYTPARPALWPGLVLQGFLGLPEVSAPLSAASCSPDSRTTQGASLWEPSVARCRWSAAHSGRRRGVSE